MHPELRHLLDRSKFHKGTIVAVAALLPADASELDALIAETVKGKDQDAFIKVTMAALTTGRAVDARHLAGGAMMLQDPLLLGGVAWHTEGEVPEALIAAMEHTMLAPVTEAACLLLVFGWCEEHGGRALPASFLPRARTLARSRYLRVQGLGYLVALAHCTADAGLQAIIKDHYDTTKDAAIKRVRDGGVQQGERFLKFCRGPLQDLLPVAPPMALAQGSTMRRSVARVGRNDACPCGSGKKYKHCCIAKDEERLRYSSGVAGKTLDELRTELEEHLTFDNLLKQNPHDVARWDPRKLKPELRERYFNILCWANLLDRAVEAFELLDWTDDSKERWHMVVFYLAEAGRKELLQRMMKVRPEAVALEEPVQLAGALVLAGDDAAQILRLLECEAIAALESENSDMWAGFSHALLASKFQGLGIFVARSMMSVLPQERASRLFESLLEARDKLKLPPDDPFGDILDERFRKEDAGEGKEADALREAQGRLDAKAKEVGLLREALDRLHVEVKQREQAPPPVMAVATPVPVPVDEPVLRELRRKVAGLRAALNERHEERNELRRDLQKAHVELDLLHQNAPPAAPKLQEERDSAGEEEELFMPAEPFINQPLRIIEFPKRFQEGLVSLPRSVGRGTLTLLGRLAAGEPAAFVGVVRLKMCHGIFRQRIGIDFRLLFKLLPDRVLVVDLVPKQDLLRRIKTLQ